MSNTKNFSAFFASLFAAILYTLPTPGYAQQADLAAMQTKISDLQKQIDNLEYTFDKLEKDIDDLAWQKRIEKHGYVDKVRLTGPPAAVVKNPTGKGVGNPVVIYAYIFIPENIDINKKYPLIVLPHGGVHGNFGSKNAHIVVELLHQGYVVVAPEYRGSTGYGKRFQQLIDYGGLENDDVKACRDYMLENYDFIDRKRVGIIGWSHGGMITLMNLFNYPSSYVVGYAGVPVSDLIARMGYMTAGYRKLYAADYHIGKEAWENVDEYRRRSPVWNAEKLQTPILIHGNTNDDDVNILEVEHLIRSLKAEDKTFEYEIYEDFPGGHHFDRIDSYGAKEVRLKVYRFLAPYLKPGRPFNNVQELIKASYFPVSEVNQKNGN